MLHLPDLFLIIALSAACTFAVTITAAGISRWQRRRSITFHLVIAVLAAVVSILFSAFVIAAQMYLSMHDIHVLLWILGGSSIMSVGAAFVTAAPARRALNSLAVLVRRVGDGQIVDSDEGIGHDFAGLSAQIASVSYDLAEARKELERLDKARRQFFAWVSHDLRTPLTGITTLAEALDDDDVCDSKQYIHGIRSRAESMHRLVDDLFELSQIQAGTLTLRKQNINLTDVVSDAVSDVSTFATAKGVELKYNSPESYEVCVDPHYMTRVIINILTNGIRHTGERTTILLQAWADEDYVNLTIRDNGPGVPVDDLEHVFEIGWQATSARTPKIGITNAGLGLAFVRGVMEAHTGRADASNVPTGGLEVQLAIPKAVP